MISAKYIRARHSQLLSEIDLYERQSRKRGIGFAIGMAAFCVLLYVAVAIGLEALIEGTPLTVLLRGYKWHGLVVQLVIWTVVFYYWLAKEPKLQLERSKAELEKLCAKYPELITTPVTGTGS